jgi:signal transduction histidine kinase/CheY-like chemotaxis protein
LSTPASERPGSQGVGNPLEWSVVERCRLLILLTLPFFVGYGLRSAWLIAHPEVEPYFDRSWLVWMRDWIAGAVAFWAAFLAFGSVERRRPGPHTLYACVGTLSWWMAVAAVAYGLGPVTSPAWIAILIGGVSQLLLLPRGPALLGIGFGLTLVVAAMAAAAAGTLPYAPMMSGAPVVAGRIEVPHAIGATTASLAATLALVVVVDYIVRRWRDAHEHLVRLNADLERIVAERTRELLDAEAQLRQAEKMEAIGRLAGGIAHDFNNLLAVITGYADLLREAEGTDGAFQRELGEIRAAAAHASRLVGQLLAVGRRQVMEPESLDLNDVVHETRDLLRPLIGEDVELRLRLDDKLGRVAVDLVQMQQVILNLAANARDAMPDGGALTLETANLEVAAPTLVGATVLPPGSWVTLTVTDTGRGMDAELQQRAFEPFFTTKEPGRGTGLGLSSVQGIVEQSGGLVGLESAPGEGSSFGVYLPRLAAAPGADAPRPREPALPARPGTVLLAEDDVALRRLLRRTLSAQRHTVLSAADGSEALELARRHAGRLDVVLTDVIMPRSGGRALAEEVVRLHPEASVIFMTGYTDDAVLLRGLSAQEVKLLRKPFPLEALSAALAEVLGHAER